MSFSDEAIERYARQLVLREVGGQGQQKLSAARVLLVGAGGLGAPAALYLAAAGVGTIGLADPDTVALSNLQRQVLYAGADIAKLKVDAAAERLAALNPLVQVRPHAFAVTDANARALVADYDLILDGTDSFETRFTVNAACYAERRTLVSGAIGRWTGQVGVFSAGPTRGLPIADRLPCYRCWVPEVPPDAETCAAVGVIGALGGVIGSMMAVEAIKLITGAGEPLSGRLLIYDALAAETRTVRITSDPACPVCGGGDERLPDLSPVAQDRPPKPPIRAARGGDVAMKLYTSVGPNPRVVKMFIAEKGIDVPRVEMDLMGAENRQAAHVARNPSGQSPSLELDDGFHLSEITAICEYLEEKQPQPPLIGTTPKERAETRMWVRRIDLYIIEPMLMGFRGAEGKRLFESRMRIIPQASDDLKALAREKLVWLNGLMEGRQFVCGDRFTLADIFLYCMVEFGGTVGQGLDPENKAIAAVMERVKARPSAAASA